MRSVRLLPFFWGITLGLPTNSIHSEVDVSFQPYVYSSQDRSTQKPPSSRNLYRDRESNGGVRLGVSGDLEGDIAYWEGGFDLLARGMGGDQADGVRLYPARDAHVGFVFPFGDFWLGRKSFYRAGREDSWIHSWNGIRRNEDGGDGIGIESRFFSDTMIQLFLWDFYSGFSLWQYHQTPIYGIEEKSEYLGGERYRQGVRVLHNYKNWSFGGDFFYLNLGNWGRSSQDDLRLRQEEGGDGDFLLRYRVEGMFSTENWGLGLEYHLTRGLDKTFSAPNRPERSLPIQGEAIVIKIFWEDKGYFVNFFQFLPNTPSTGESIEPLTVGYVGMGNSYSRSHFISRERNLFPSVWVTPWGKEWNSWDSDSVWGTRASASFSAIDLGIRISDWRFIVCGEYILPRRIQIQDRGQISIRKADYESYFIAESGLRVLYSSRTDSIDSELGLEVSYFWGNDDLKIQGSFIQLFGRFVF